MSASTISSSICCESPPSALPQALITTSDVITTSRVRIEGLCRCSVIRCEISADLELLSCLVRKRN
ncbi:MAG TPA: hypothetical protein DEO42_09420 [Acidimicrobium sp.]|nr:hypothetical protein [Acidimicrobium sp.]